MFSGPKHMGRSYNLILCVSVQIAGVAGTCQKETRCVVSVSSGVTHLLHGVLHILKPHTHRLWLCKAWTACVKCIRASAGVAWLQTSCKRSGRCRTEHPYITQFLTPCWMCRNSCAALGVHSSGAVVFPSPHLHVELDLKKVFGIINSISSIVSYSVITIKRC